MVPIGGHDLFVDAFDYLEGDSMEGLKDIIGM